MVTPAFGGVKANRAAEAGVIEADLKGNGVPAPLASALTTVLAVSPPGAALDVLQGLTRAIEDSSRGKPGAWTHLAEAGISLTRINTIKKAAKGLTPHLARHAARILPQTFVKRAAKELAGAGLAVDMARDSIQAALQNPDRPLAESIALGMTQAIAKDVVAKSGKALAELSDSDLTDAIIRKTKEIPMFGEIAEGVRDEIIKDVVFDLYTNQKGGK